MLICTSYMEVVCLCRRHEDEEDVTVFGGHRLSRIGQVTLQGLLVGASVMRKVWISVSAIVQLAGTLGSRPSDPILSPDGGMLFPTNYSVVVLCHDKTVAAFFDLSTVKGVGSWFARAYFSRHLPKVLMHQCARAPAHKVLMRAEYPSQPHWNPISIFLTSPALQFTNPLTVT